MSDYNINIPDIYDLYDYNRSNENTSNIIQRIKIEIINKNIKVYVYYNKFYVEYINKNEEQNIVIFKDIFQNINTKENQEFIFYSHLFFKINNNKNKHIIIKNTKIINSFELFDNLFYNDIYPTDYTLELDTSYNDIIMIYFSKLKGHFGPYNFKNIISNKLELNTYCKYITIKLEDIDYDYNINNQHINIKINNNVIEFRCVIKYNELNLIFIKINENYTSNVLNKNCVECNKINNYDKFTNITQEIKEYLKHNFIKNIIDCDTHYNNDDDLINKCQLYINIIELLNELGIDTSHKYFNIRYNYAH